MRRSAVLIALALTVAGSAPALAGGGLPQVAALQVGPFTVALHNDAATLVTGNNTLTVEVPALPERHAVNLSLTGPHGQRLDVPLRPVWVLETATEEHGGGHAATSPAPSSAGAHDAPATVVHNDAALDAHASAGVVGHDLAPMRHEASDAGHEPAVAPESIAPANALHTSGGETYLARGSASIPESGTWHARIVIVEAGGESFAAEAPLVAEEGGPSRLYLAGTGALMGGFLLYGATLRRRLYATPQKTRSLEL